jgi:uncharacterized protein YgiM (DUF1202 family)
MKGFKSMKIKTLKSLLIATTMTATILTGCGSKDTESEIESEITTEFETATIEETTTESETETTKEETSTIEETATEEETTTETESFSYTVSELDKTMVANDNGRLREAPSTTSDVVRTIDKDDTIKVTGKVNEADWYQVNIDNQTLYISASLLSEIEVKSENKETTTNKNKDTTSSSSSQTTTPSTTPTETPSTETPSTETPSTPDTTPTETSSTDTVTSVPDTTTSNSEETNENGLKVGESRVEKDGCITTYMGDSSNYGNWK